MGYGSYLLPDGREAGYNVEADCDSPGCTTKVFRGLDGVCGHAPEGHREPGRGGCGFYFCGVHEDDHGCANATCGVWDDEEMTTCVLSATHVDQWVPHQDMDGNTFFTPMSADAMAVSYDEPVQP